MHFANSSPERPRTKKPSIRRALRWVAPLVPLLPTINARAELFADFTFPIGRIRVELFETQKPVTVDNFVRHIEENRYANSFLHRWIPGFVVQGGGFNVVNIAEGNPSFGLVEEFDPIVNEYDSGETISNTYGTIAMAKLPGDPDSATSEWFFNLADNSENLDAQNGGFTVFGRVVGGFDVLERFNTLTQENGIFLADAGGAFTDLPVTNPVSASFGDLLFFNIEIRRLEGRVSIQPDPEGGLTIVYDGAVPGSDYILQSSQDSQTWSALTEKTSASEQVEFSITPDNSQSHQLFRVLRPL